MAKTERRPETTVDVGHKTTSSAQSLFVAIALSAATAGLNILANEVDVLGPLLLVTYVPMLVAQHHVLSTRWAGIAPAIGIALPALWGIATAIPATASPAIRYSPIGLAVILLVLGHLDRRLMLATRYRYFVFLVPLIWTAVFFVLSRGATGTIAQPANALHAFPAVLQPVSIIGSLGLCLVIYAVNYCFGAIALRTVGHPDFPSRRVRRVAVAIVVGSVVWVGASLSSFASPDATLRVAAMQPGPLSAAVTGETVDRLSTFEELTRDAAGRGAKLVVWPETGLPFDPKVHDGDRIRDLARETGAHIAVGYGVWTRGSARNEAIIVTPDGRFLGPYAKQHPVTFLGERSDSDHGYPVFDTDLGRMALLICYDLDYVDTPRRMADQGARLIAAPSNDWAEIADIHYEGFVLRAIENRVTLVKADTAWDSAIIDPYGRVLAKKISPQGDQAVLVADVPLGPGRSPAVALGDSTALLITAGAIVVLLVAIGDARRRRDRTPKPSDAT